MTAIRCLGRPVLAFLTVLLLARFAAADAWTSDDAAHLLRRAGFGGTPEQIDALHALGKNGAVEYLLTGQLPIGAKPPFAHADLEPFKLTPITGADQQAKNRQRFQDFQRLRLWWIERMIRTDRPLEEKMALFWHGLLTSGAREVREPEMLVEQNALFHVQAVGNYRQLIHQILHDPAMLRYLNADQNIKGKPNENLARELMELFTLGQGNGYTEKDVAEVARALTGARVVQGKYFFGPFRHDDGFKTIFGVSGRFGPDDVPELIFRGPQPAKYLARRLWVYFASPDPTEADLRPIEQALLQSNYELKPALRAMFTSPAFYSLRVKFAQIKSPVELVIGTVRMLELPISDRLLRSSLAAIDGMGQVLFQPPNVRGWPGGESWITSATLFTRYNAASALVEGGFGAGIVESHLVKPADTEHPEEFVEQCARRFLGRAWTAEKRDALVKVIGQGNGGASPNLQSSRGARSIAQSAQHARRVKQMIGLLLSTPEYQVE